MDNNTLITVAMSVYNAEKYIEETIESILVQTYENFELIIINDGSTDGSLEIINKYKKIDKRIILINRENKGLVTSLNECIEKANGEYIVRMDADDICLPSRFEEQLKFMQENQLSLCGTWVETFDEKNSINIWTYPEGHTDILFRSFFMSSFAHPSVMIKKNVFDTLKYENKVAEDYKLWCDILANGYKTGNIQKVLLKYRLHDGQITQNQVKELIYSVNDTGLDFVKKINPNCIAIVENAIDIQSNCSFSKLNKLIKDILNYSREREINKENLYFIIKTLYRNASPKSPITYYKYFKATNGMKRNLKEESNLCFKSLIFVNRDSKVYQFLKKIMD